MECGICLENIEHSCVVLPCMHHFCFVCVIQTCHLQHTRCPKCRSFIHGVLRDKEFDNLHGHRESIHTTIPMNRNVIRIDAGTAGIGITLCNNVRPFGVVVSDVESGGRAERSGILKGHIILAINNVPCISHHSSIAQMDGCDTNNLPIECYILQHTDSTEQAL